MLKLFRRKPHLKALTNHAHGGSAGGDKTSNLDRITVLSSVKGLKPNMVEYLHIQTLLPYHAVRKAE